MGKFEGIQKLKMDEGFSFEVPLNDVLLENQGVLRYADKC